MVTELVENHSPVDEFAFHLCCSDRCRQNDLERSAALRELATKIYNIADALDHMHEDASLIHFDLKPDNILVSESGRPFVTDLGFARDVSRYKPDDTVEVGFTFKYSHWRLHDVAQGARVTTVPEKSKTWLTGKELHPRFDIFAFGRTLQEVLRVLEKEYGEGIYSEYTFNYLHIVSCLCLDGLNSDTYDRDTFISDTALDMPKSLFAAHKFSSFRDVKTALERLLSLRRLEDEVPELDEWAAGTINVSDLGITTLTPRVRSLINHPTIFRLARELQLGLLEAVFPTATHTRMQHSLGVFHAVRQYIKSLYYDPENPTFRVLFSPDDCARALLATLMHDVGHTTFGHDLEEVDGKEFSHTEIGLEIIDDNSVLDTRGRTLSEIIEGSDLDCWGISASTIKELTEQYPNKPVYGIYRDILDGPLDADKLDYLIRDSVESRVRYGHGIDHSRFLRSLTTAAEEDNRKPILRLAVKQKGAASAEAFAFARYQLYQSLYWHHTFRAIKAMLLTASSLIHVELQTFQQDDLFKRPLRQAYIDYVVRRRALWLPESASKGSPSKQRKVETRSRVIYNRLSANRTPQVPGLATDDRTLIFLWKLSTGKATKLLESLMARSFYKRVIEIPLADFKDHLWLREQFLFRRDAFQNEIETALLGTLRRSIQDKMITRESLKKDDALDRVTEIAKDHQIFVVDLPLRGWYSGGDNPVYVSDYKRRHFRASVGAGRGVDADTIWSHYVNEMMLRIAFFRVFCEPRVHQVLTRVLTTEDIIASLKGAFKEFTLKAKAV